MPAISGVYQILNKINGKCYVGSSVNVEKRLRGHFDRLRKGKHTSHLQNAFNKYGEDAFETHVLKKCSILMLLVWEQRFINRLKPEYNNVPIAGNTLGYRSTKEQIEANRARNIGKTLSKETKDRIGASVKGQQVWWIGKSHTEEAKAKMSLARKGKKLSAEHKAKISSAAKVFNLGNSNAKGATRSQDVRNKISKSLKKFFKRSKNAK